MIVLSKKIHIFFLIITISLVVLFVHNRSAWALKNDAVNRRSIVKIYVTTQRPDYTMPWQTMRPHKSTGSGFVIDKQRIITNAHVVSDARFIEVQRDGDPERYIGRVIFIAHDCDLALITIDDQDFFKELEPILFGSSMPRLNDEVVVLGYPMGGIRISLTKGVVSRIDYGRYSHSGADSHLVMQVDAAINPGNSGGPVIFKGKVVGLAFQVLTRAQNIGYAIPLPVINRFLEDVSDGVYHGYPELGVYHMPTYNKALRTDLKLNNGQTGIAIYHLDPFGSAFGYLESGDVLLEMDGHKISNDGTVNLNGNSTEYSELLERKQWGQSIDVTVLRNSEELKITIPLSNPYDPYTFRKNYDEKPEYYIVGGLVFSPLTSDYLSALINRVGRRNNLHLFYYSEYGKIDGHYKDREQYVLLIRRLAHTVNTYSDGFINNIVSEINGRPIRHIRDIKAAVENEKGGFHVIRFENTKDYLVLDANSVAEAEQDILTNYMVASPEHFEDRP